MTSSVVLLSGGLCSATSLFWARQRGRAWALTIRHGQHPSRVGAARRIAEVAGVDWRAVDLELLVPEVRREPWPEEPHATSPRGIPPAHLPLFVGAAINYAMRVGADRVVLGAGRGWCRAQRGVLLATQALVGAVASPTLRIETPLEEFGGTDVVAFARLFGEDCWVALGATVTCDLGRTPGCGACEECQDRMASFEMQARPDPAGSLEGLFDNVPAGWRVVRRRDSREIGRLRAEDGRASVLRDDGTLETELEGRPCETPNAVGEWFAAYYWRTRDVLEFGSSSPNDLREQGWAIAVHNDHRLNGEPHTSWLVTRGEVALRGEGRTDVEALDQIRARLPSIGIRPARGRIEDGVR